tara:strand:+ start:240 stop:473 length:234 start_codon:yes stop_codon:yes gene_type:complete
MAYARAWIARVVGAWVTIIDCYCRSQAGAINTRIDLGTSIIVIARAIAQNMCTPNVSVAFIDCALVSVVAEFVVRRV